MLRTGMKPSPRDDRASDPAMEATVELLARARDGDAEALDTLFRRYLAPLRRWASGRLPGWARDMRDTDDLVQDTLVASLRNLKDFRAEHQGALHAYLRRAVSNGVRDELRRRARAPERVSVETATGAPSPLEEVIGAEALERYEQGLARLKPEEREAIIARIELGLSHAEVARALGKPSADAARVAVARAILRLATEMGHES